MTDLRFTIDDIERAADEWGCNCGPAAVAAICGLTLDELRPHLGDFERKRYTNPMLMWKILRSIGKPGHRIPLAFPSWGLAVIQWGGPWMAPGVTTRMRHSHTHWVGSHKTEHLLTVFDVNAMSVGGWIPFKEWRDELVPWLLVQTEPEADGLWYLTNPIEVAT